MHAAARMVRHGTAAEPSPSRSMRAPGGRLGVSGFEVAPRRQATVTVPLSAAGERRLRSHGRLPLKIAARPAGTPRAAVAG